MQTLRLIRTKSNYHIYKLLLLKKFTSNLVIEKFGNYNRRSGSLSVNIFRLLFWLSKEKNISITWYTNKILSEILVINNFKNKSFFGTPNKIRWSPVSNTNKKLFSVFSAENDNFEKIAKNHVLVSNTNKTIDQKNLAKNNFIEEEPVLRWDC